MTPDELELQDARDVHEIARRRGHFAIRAEDREACTAAILCRALELATPDLSPERRAALFLGE